MEINKIYQIDVLEGLAQLPDNSIDLIITSPPYNKTGLRGNLKRYASQKWNEVIHYAGDENADNMPEDEYQQWQTQILNECHRVLKPEGSMFYNHKNRLHNGKTYTPYEWLLNTNFIIRQEIVWDRGSTPNINKSRYMPSTERIYWLTKTKYPRFDRQQNTPFKTEVWYVPAERNTPHPAPMPLAIPDNIIPNIALGERILVLDIFMGSGTTAISAIKNGCDYIGFELFQEYVDMANKRIEDYVHSN